MSPASGINISARAVRDPASRSGSARTPVPIPWSGRPAEDRIAISGRTGRTTGVVLPRLTSRSVAQNELQFVCDNASEAVPLLGGDSWGDVLQGMVRSRSWTCFQSYSDVLIGCSASLRQDSSHAHMVSE